jgi:hypothetical protein
MIIFGRVYFRNPGQDEKGQRIFLSAYVKLSMKNKVGIVNTGENQSHKYQSLAFFSSD